MLGIAILAAGKGKRMNSIDKPKVLVQLNSKSLLGYVIDTALGLNPFKIYVIVGFKKELVIDFIKSNYSDPRIEIVEQKEQLGTGHAILQLEPVIDFQIKNLLILSGDVPLISTTTLKTFTEFHFDGNYDLSLISTKLENPFGYGRIVRNEFGALLSIVEQKDLKPEQEDIKEINTGIYIVRTDLLFNYLRMIDNNNAQQEYYLTDIVKFFVSDQKNVGAFVVNDYTEVLGVNNLDELQYLESLLKQKVS